MIDILLYDRDANEQARITRRVRDSVALLSDERLDCHGYRDAAQVDRHLAADKPYDLSVLEVSEDADIALTKRVRAGREQADMMLLADSRISPMRYLTPEIRACSLLLRPFSEGDLRTVTGEFMSAFFRRREVPTDDNSIVIENRQGRMVVPFSHIYYIEVREKRVFFRLRDREYSKYDTLDNIRAQLPSNFVQSHRSFIFNASYLDRIKLSDNTVYLEHGITVPLSRSYKASIKEYLSGLSTNRIDTFE